MPITPQFTWDQSAEDVHIHVTLKGVKKEAVDVFISDLFIKANAHPTYLLALDLLHAVDPEKSTFYFEDVDEVEVENSATMATAGEASSAGPAVGGGRALRLHVKLTKAEPDQLWDALCIKGTSMGKRELLERRTAAMQRAETRYNEKLEARRQQRDVEKRRMQEAQWSVEKEQRQTIEKRVNAEKEEAEQDLYSWEEATQAAQTASATTEEETHAARAVPASPADILAGAMTSASPSPSSSTTPPPPPPPSSSVSTSDAKPAPHVPLVRQTETLTVTIDFTPQTMTLPTRSRGDEEYYRRSRYKPVSVEDSPMFWKDRGDTFFKAHDWRGAANAYSESIKRDGVFMTCVMNRAACLLHLSEYKRAAEDCTLALTLLSNTPASECTQDRYRMLMTRLHARRGAAYCWADDLKSGLQDLRMAAAYADPERDADVLRDLEAVEERMKEKGIVPDEVDAMSVHMQKAAGHYYKAEYDAAEALYRAVLDENNYHTEARNNLIAVLLHQKQFKPALEECQKVIGFCQEVAEALNQPDYLDTVDSDDEEETAAAADGLTNEMTATDAESGVGVDEHVRQRRAAAKKVLENSAHVYILLKAYVRGAAALCGLNEYRQAHAWLEKAVRITPYDNDLLDDCNRIAEKVRMDALLAATTTNRPKESVDGTGESAAAVIAA